MGRKRFERLRRKIEVEEEEEVNKQNIGNMAVRDLRK